MAIKDPLMFITIEEFKTWNGFNKLEFDEITTPDSEIFKAISIASNNIDYLSGFTISPKWPEITPTDFTDEIQTATAYYVNFLLTKDVNYLRGQASISQGGITYSENNPDDPYFIVPEVFSCLRKIKHYLTFKGFPLNVSPRKSNTFFGNGGNENILERYLQIPDLETNDPRVKIKQTHPKNRNTVVIIDTNGIKTDIDNSLWEVNKDNPNFIVPKDDKGIDVNGKRIIDVGTPTFLSDATTKEYVDNLLDKKQDKLIAGENIKIDKETNTISASSSGESLWEYDPNSPNILQPKIKGDVKPLITSNNTRIVDIADPTQPQDAVNKRYVDNKIQPIPNIPQWKEVGQVVIDKNNLTHIEYIFKDKTHYRIYISYGDYTSKENNKNYSWQIINFYYQLDTNVLKSSLWISNNNVNADTEINIYNNRIMWGMGRDYIFKRLEELQE